MDTSSTSELLLDDSRNMLPCNVLCAVSTMAWLEISENRAFKARIGLAFLMNMIEDKLGEV